MKALPLAVLVLIVAGCGGSSGGGGGPSLPATPQLTAVTPTANAAAHPVDVTTFAIAADRDLDPATVNDTNVFVIESGPAGHGRLAGAVTYTAAARTIAWTLAAGQTLNAFFPAADILDFARPYTLNVESAVRDLAGVSLAADFAVSFTSAPPALAALAAGSDPQPGTTTALIDPFYRSVNGEVVETLLAVRLDLPLEPVSVTAPGNVLVRRGATLVPGTTAFDVTTNTICWIPSGSANPNPLFPGEPLLATATAYTLVVTSAVAVSATGGPLLPGGDLEVPFTTISVPIRSPADVTAIAGATKVADLQVNECFSNPGTTTASDSNRDGIVDEGDDEFIEIVNVSPHYLDLFEHLIEDDAGTELIRFDDTNLPQGTRHRALLAPGRALVVWCGGTITADVRLAPRAKMHVGDTAGAGLWNNAGDIARIFDTGVFGGSLRMQAGFGSTGDGVSRQRVPELTGPFTTHPGATGTKRHSPGLRANGTPFP